MEEHVKENNNKTIFLSYNWHDGEIADRIDKYLSGLSNCMFEVTEIMKEQEYKDRIFPAVVEHGIYDPLIRAKYIKYWQEECNKLEAAIKGLDLANVTELTADLKYYKSIASSMGEFLSIVVDKK